MRTLVKLSLIATIPLAISILQLTTRSVPAAKVSIIASQSDSTYGPANLIAPGTKPVMISKQFEFTEGPAADAKGNVYFTDQPNSTIWKYGTDGKLSLFTDKAGRSNGTFFDAKGHLVTCADDQGELWRFDATGRQHETLLTGVDGKRLNGPNDLWMDARGGIYFTDPYYQRNYWTRTTSALDGEKVYYLPAGRHEPIVASSALLKPNGIAGSRDGKYLFVADIKAGKTYRFTIGTKGELTDQQLFTKMGSDGMTLDDEGNVYLTGGKGVTIFDPQGNKLGLIRIEEPWTGNVCFGGPDRRTLFITASKAIYTVNMKVKGSTKNAQKLR
ncbi:SMP-30/gluconolactonase/LRE family protein [Mucilaginibacter daejeonensis]|uniref:SMP-30/gluconolactonase/LRE family protein n=1 Tax=Mucilaginibacter daejeonensis TaxID=398049 RepID=UPI001D17C75C|nr:SMP-30/gluconolactonase/LRE family protein [Mucilaginibacter daejeonensis]UEG55274.1 SMP-30/gluconolactonase/LRE family protein [Mucilaginibacter daejeonensis]